MSATATQPSHEEAGYSRDSRRWFVLGAVVIGTFMSIVDSTVVNIALPKIISVFSTDVHGAQWVLTGYLLALAVVIPLTGFVDETIGGKRAYIVSLILFTSASALCGIAWSLNVMILFRVLQGLGGGLIQPLGMSLLLREFRPEERGTALGFFGIPLMLGPAVGPILGGYLVQYVDWRFIFYINLPVGILAVIACSRFLREDTLHPGRKLDAWGVGLVGFGSAALLYGIDNGPADGWTSTWVVAEILVGIVALIAFVFVELRSDQPLLELRLFKIPNFSTAVFVTLIVQVGLFGAMFLLPIFLENIEGLGAMETGLLWLPQSLVVAMVMPLSGRIFDRYGPTVVLVPGITLLVIATWLFSHLTTATSTLTIIEILLVRGTGMGLAMMPATTAAMNAVPRNLIPRATALTSAVQRIAGSFGTAIMATELSSRQTFQFASIAETVTPFDPGVHLAVSRVGEMLQTHGMSAVAAHQLGILMLYQRVEILASVRAFDDTFLFAAVLCIPAIAAAFLVRNTKTAGGGRRAMLGAE
ncbi:MAG TPA: DHA2 family efflux MFS transporter permease subunit [Chloroflexota bacterium]|nr:DHA2 family efflux MFS transporter permease subunit [Chloroflexota bacterium]